MSCSITDSRNSYVYITGGVIYNGAMEATTQRNVTRYSPDGSSKDLPALNTNRFSHACSGYYNQKDHFVLLVVGGKSWVTDGKNGVLFSFYSGSSDLNLTSTELFEVEISSQWKTLTNSPLRLWVLSAVTIHNKIYVTGDVSLLLNNSLEII